MLLTTGNQQGSDGKNEERFHSTQDYAPVVVAGGLVKGLPGLAEIERAALAEFLVAEGVDAMTHAVGQGHEQSVVGGTLKV